MRVRVEGERGVNGSVRVRVSRSESGSGCGERVAMEDEWE